MRVDGNQGSTIAYEPNSYGEWEDRKHLDEPVLDLIGPASRWDFHEDDNHYFEQPGKLFMLMDDEAKQRLFDNTARNMGDSEDHIKVRHITHCYKAHPDYGAGVAKALGFDIDKIIQEMA